MTKKIAVIIGSLRKESFNRKMAHVLMSLAPQNLELKIVEIGNLPIYNEDLDRENPPEAWLEFRKEMKQYDGILFATPEYNRSIPGVLKNAIDVGSRPYGQSIWSAKPAAIISLSLGAMGGFAANHHLRQCMVCLDVPTMQQPEAYIAQAGNVFNEQGKITKEETLAFLSQFMSTFSRWVEQNTSAKRP